MRKSEETLKIIEDFPELNEKLMVATGGIVKILESVKENFGTEKADYSGYKDDYQKCYNTIEMLIDEYNEVENGRVKVMLENIKGGMRCEERIHEQGFSSCDSLDLAIEMSHPLSWEIYLVE